MRTHDFCNVGVGFWMQSGDGLLNLRSFFYIYCRNLIALNKQSPSDTTDFYSWSKGFSCTWYFIASHLLSLFPNPHLAGPLTLSHSVAESTPRSCPLEAVFTHPPQQRGTEERPEAQRQAAGAGRRKTREITGEEKTRQEMKIRDAYRRKWCWERHRKVLSLTNQLSVMCLKRCVISAVRRLEHKDENVSKYQVA